jgi:hypothetical protein
MSSEQLDETYAPARLPDALGGDASMLRGIAAAARRGLTYRHVLVVGSGIFLLSNALIAPGLAPAAALLVLAGCIGSLWIVVKATAGAPTGLLATPIEPRTFALCWGAALALFALGGEGHVFFANYDWLNRDAVLADLGRQRFPVFYTYQGAEFFLRAPRRVPHSGCGRETARRLLRGAPGAAGAERQFTAVLTCSAMVPRRRAAFLAVFVTFPGSRSSGAASMSRSRIAGANGGRYALASRLVEIRCSVPSH